MVWCREQLGEVHANSRCGGVTQSLVLLCLIVGPGIAQAQSGVLDNTFSRDGLVTTDILNSSEGINAVALQGDAKIVAAGFARNAFTRQTEFALTRYTPNGALDNAFGQNGRVTTDASPGDDGIVAVAIQPDGKIATAGYAIISGNAQVIVARYTGIGALDPTFGSNGVVSLDAGNPTALALQPDGKLLVASITFTGGSEDGSIVRLNDDGSLDTVFGSGGIATLDFPVSDIGLDADGTIAAAGSDVIVVGFDFEGPISRQVVAAARLTGDGQLDPTFGGTGKVTTDASPVASRAVAVLVQPDGKVVAAGNANTMFLVVRYAVDGSLDTSFGGTGVVTTAVGDGDQLFDGVLQEDGKIAVAGWATDEATSNNFGLVRYNVDGSLDTDFGSDGKVVTDFGNSTADIATGVAVAPGHRLVAAGTTNFGDTRTDTFAIARYR
jgi:uncharacterized delta-60 repeat protein